MNLVRKVLTFTDNVLFHGEHEREVEWVIGAVIVGVVLLVVVDLLR